MTEPSPPAASSRTPRPCLVLAAVAFALRLALALRPLVTLDRLFVPDDTYYTLAIARSIARGIGPSVDGIHLTSGFQPLVAFLLAAWIRWCSDPDIALRVALVIGVVADTVTVWLLGHLASRLGAGARGAIVASLTWALSIAAIATSLNGLESSLSVAIVLGALATWLRARSRGTLRAWALTGAMLGLSLLARVDTVFFVVAVGVATLRRASFRSVVVVVAAAVVVVAPWWGYSLLRFGSFVPESGSAVREQTLVYASLGSTVRDHVAWATGAVFGPPLFDSRWLRQALGSGASAVGCGLGVVLVVSAFVVGRRSRSDALRILTGFAVALFVFYALYLPATWFFRRYLVPVHAWTALVVALVAGVGWRARPTWLRRSLALAYGVSVVASVATIVWMLVVVPSATIDQGHHGVKGYREPAREVLALAPKGAVIGSFQSGALGFFADGTERTVVNLDGVVDGEAARAVREGRIAEFARARGVTHLADWGANVRLFLARAGDPRMTRALLRPLGEASSQGPNERFVLYEIAWPE